MNRLRCASSHAVRLSLLVLLLVGASFLLGCDSDDPVDPAGPPPPVAPDIDTLGVPQFWVYDSPLYRSLQVSLSFPAELTQAIVNQEVAAPRVHAVLQPLGASGLGEVFDFYDDGSGPDIQTSNSFVDDTSGDLVARDLVYTVRLNSRFAPAEGEYLLTVEAGWFSDDYPLPYSTTISDTILVEVNSPPVIASFEHSDSLHSGFEEEVWSAMVTDPDVAGGDAVDIVEMHLIPEDGTTSTDKLLAPQGSGLWTFHLDAGFAAGMHTANYTLRLTANDRFNQPAISYEGSVWIENTPPVISNLVAPDTVYRPEGDNPPPNSYDLFLDVADLQTSSDIDRVDYLVINPNGGIGTHPDFFFNDFGNPPDVTAGDGVYSHRFNVPDSVRVFGQYTFIFTATDRGGNASNSITHFIQLMNTGGK